MSPQFFISIVALIFAQAASAGDCQKIQRGVQTLESVLSAFESSENARAGQRTACFKLGEFNALQITEPALPSLLESPELYCQGLSFVSANVFGILVPIRPIPLSASFAKDVTQAKNELDAFFQSRCTGQSEFEGGKQPHLGAFCKENGPHSDLFCQENRCTNLMQSKFQLAYAEKQFNSSTPGSADRAFCSYIGNALGQDIADASQLLSDLLELPSHFCLNEWNGVLSNDLEALLKTREIGILATDLQAAAEFLDEQWEESCFYKAQ